MQLYMIGLDLGTSSCKAVGLDEDGRPLAVASAPLRLYTPAPGLAEQRPEEAWAAAADALRLLAARLSPIDALGICLSGAMHSLFPLDGETSRPLGPALTWADQRAANQASHLRAEAGASEIYRRTGCPLRAIYHPARLRWFSEVAELPQGTRCAALKDYVLFQLTGEWATDWSLGSTTGLLDITRLEWDAGALALARVAPALLPPLVSPTAVVGHLTHKAAAQASLPAGLPVIAGGSDGGLANFGAGVTKPGQRVVSLGTSGAVRQVCAEPLFDDMERTWCYVFEQGQWFAGGAVNNVGLAFDWARRQFYPDLSPEAGFSRLFQDAAAADPGAGGLIFLPYLTGERSPHWDPEARAALYGLSLSHSRADIARAILEGVAFSLGDVWEALGPASSATLTAGAVWPSVFTRVLANVLDTTLIPVRSMDASATGAALLGLQALGREVRPQVDAGPEVRSDPQLVAFYHDLHHRFQELYRLSYTP